MAPETRHALTGFAARHGLPPPAVVEGHALGQRHRARLAVRGRARSPKVGLFQEGSHRIVDIPTCAAHHPLVNEVAAALKTALRQTGVAPYAERPHVGVLRTLQVVVERSSRTAQIVLVANEAVPDASLRVAEALRVLLGDALHSLWWNGNPERTNTLLGPHWRHLCGPETVRERLGGCDVHFPPGAFGQSNLPLADDLVRRVHAWLAGAVRIVEFHAGCGAIGLGLLARGAEVSFNEVDPHGVRGLGHSLAQLAPDVARRARVLDGPAASHAGALASCDAAIIDPPRKGLEPALLEALAANPPERLVWVSCDLARFLDQAQWLLVASPLRLRAREAWALFPYTRHVETLALFSRDA